VQLILGSLGIVFLIPAMWYTMYRRKQPTETWAFTAVFCAYALFYVFVFARGVYSRIPAHLGGGKIKEVQFLLDVNDDDKKFFELSGLLFYEKTNWTKSAKLLFTTDDEYVLQVRPPEWPPESASTLSIKRDLIKSVLYEGLRGGGVSGELPREEPTPSPSVTPAQTLPSQPVTSPTPRPSPSLQQPSPVHNEP